MKFIKQAAFILSMMAIMVHIIIPHLHSESDSFEDHSISVVNSNFGLTAVQHALTHFEHVSGNENIVLKKIEKKDFFKKPLFSSFFADIQDTTFRWKDITVSNYSVYFLFCFTEPEHHSFSLRGPPLS